MSIKDFGVSMFKVVYSPMVNTLVSPLSITTALSMVANTAKGHTLDEFLQTLGVKGGLDELNIFFKDTLRALASNSIEQVLMANALFLHEDLKKVKDTVDRLGEIYQAEIRSVDFRNSAIEDINSWVFEKTKGKIIDLIKDLDPLSAAVIINAIYFKGEWQDAYPKERTRLRDFNNLNGSQVEVEFMHKKTFLKYVHTLDCLGFVDMYKGGSKFFVLMPKDFKEYMANFSYSVLVDFLVWSKEEGEIELSMPKFKVETPTFSIVDELRGLGIHEAFEVSADFSGLGTMSDGWPLFIKDVIHKATFEVDEEGTVAAAATAALCMRGMSLDLTPEITIDKPFIYGIVNEDNMPIFIGSVVKL